MNRIVDNDQYNYPKVFYFVMFGIDFLCRISWIFGPTSAVLIGLIRKLIENYCRLEAQAVLLEKKKKNNDSIFKEIMHLAGLDHIAA